MSRNAVETVMGAVVLIIAGIFLAFAYSSSQTRSVDGYDVTAKFDHIDGTSVGGDVRISGIKVGTILAQTLDPKTFQAVVRMRLDKSIQLPANSVATITSSGLLGDKYMQLVPGADDKTIPAGGEIKFTQAPVSLESMLGQAVFSMQGGGAKPADAAAGSSPPAGPAPSASPEPSAGPTPSSPPAHK